MAEQYGFELIAEQEIPELNIKGRYFRHTATGAELLSLENDDENKVFSINFRTTPKDSTGVAHILEHSVLCGSEKYPVKEPFVELVKGSLQTFVNAFTFPDKTCYPCASQNLQDFYNLIDVYMDAVLHPLLPPHVLEQEGWHYEMESPDAPLTYKGVVFNEMKGALSDPNDLLGEASQQSLFPDNTYQYNSGGDPKEITELTYAQFKDFHSTYYHPSNARIFWYGDDDPTERLRRTAEYLKGYQRLEVDSVVPLQDPFEERLNVTYPYAVGNEEPKYYVAANWVLGEQTDPELSMGLGLLSHILVGTSAAPLRKALIDSGYGEDIIGGGLGPHLRQLTFSTGLKGVKREDAAKVETLIDETLATLAQNGIDPETVTASMNTVEFQLRENNTGSFPRGISLLLRSLTTWLHDGDPFAPLAFEEPLQAIQEKLAAGEGYFEALIQRYFIENNHRSTVILEPDPELNQRETAEEEARLETVRAKMSQAELDEVAEKAEKLKAIQETPDTPEALATLPVLTLDDLDTENKNIPIEALHDQGVEVLYHDLFTNGIAYFDVILDLQAVPQELLPYLDLFAQGMVKMGTEQEDFVRLSQRIGSQTGGISPSIYLNNRYASKKVVAKLVLRGKATVDKVGEMLKIFSEILLTTKYDNPERFRQILTERKARLESSLVPSGHAMVNQRLKAAHSLSGWVSEQVGGIENLFFSRRLLEEMENDWAGVASKFEQIRQAVVRRKGLLINVTLDTENWRQVRPQLAGFIESIPAKDAVLQTWQPTAAPLAEGLTIPAQVNYVGKGINLYDLGYQTHGSQSVIRKYLGTTYLWEKVRVQGGAYGVFMVFDPFSGVLNYISYRDPNLLGTLDNYDGTPAFLRRLEISEAELTKSIIGVIGDMDAYQLPDAKGFTSMTRYLTGYSDAERQRTRDEVLHTRPSDFTAYVEVLTQAAQKGLVVVIGSAEAIAEANRERVGFLKVTQVL